MKTYNWEKITTPGPNNNRQSVYYHNNIPYFLTLMPEGEIYSVDEGWSWDGDIQPNLLGTYSTPQQLESAVSSRKTMEEKNFPPLL